MASVRLFLFFFVFSWNVRIEWHICSGTGLRCVISWRRCSTVSGQSPACCCCCFSSSSSSLCSECSCSAAGLTSPRLATSRAVTSTRSGNRFSPSFRFATNAKFTPQRLLLFTYLRTSTAMRDWLELIFCRWRCVEVLSHTYTFDGGLCSWLLITREASVQRGNMSDIQ